MKPLKTLLISLIVISFMPIEANADDGNTIYYYSKSTMIPMKISLDDLDKMTFSDDGFLMWKQSGVYEIPFDDFLLFSFSEIEHPLASTVTPTFLPQDLSFQFVANLGILIIESRLPLSGVNIYDLQGRIVANFSTNNTIYNVTLPISRSGVYIVNVVRDGMVLVKKIVI